MRSAVAAGALLPLLLITSRASADDPRDVASAERVSARVDLFFRFTPQPRLTTEETPAGSEQRYWRAVSTAPVYERAAVDAQGLWGGRVEAHLSGWAAVDLFASQDSVAAGDLALGWARVAGPVFGAWGGRRFVEWGLPGGLHVDGVGVEARPVSGLTVEAVAGRPVTPRYDGSQGPVGSFDGVAAAWGVRARFLHAGRLALSASWMERWTEGLPQRAASADALWVAGSRLELRGSVVLDPDSARVVQGRAEALALLGARSDVSAGWSHADVALLIPRWSILSVFAGPVYDEFYAGGTWRPKRSLAFGVEAALRLLDVPGRSAEAQGPALATRFDARVRLVLRPDGPQGLLHVSRRDDGVRSLTVLRAVASFPVWTRLDAMLEAAAALDDDDPAAPRSAYYGRTTLELRLGGAWRVGATVDAARSVVAAVEVRTALHATWVGGNARRTP